MRRILVEGARRKKRLKRGGDLRRVELGQLAETADLDDDRLLAVDEALERLSLEDAQAAQLVKLRFFAGLSITDAARVLGISRTHAYDLWAYARAWLRCEIEGGGGS